MTLTTLGPEDDTEAGIRGDLQGAVNARKTTLRIDQQARAELAAENASRPPPAFNGADFLAQADEEAVYRIAGLWPMGGNVVLAAQYKTGKTTLVHNLIRSLCDGTPFLGRFHVDPPDGTIFVLDTEMPGPSARRWIREQSVKDPARFTYQNLRGAASSFDLLEPGTRRRWARRIAAAGTGVVILDCLGPVLAALGLDENSNTDVGRFLGAFAELLAEAGAQESAVVHHMGHAGERTRGGSKLRDWPDAEWRLVRADDNPASPRYFSAFGRDVDESESHLEFDPVTRHLRVAGGSRMAAKTADAVRALIKAVADEPGQTTNALRTALVDSGEHPQGAFRDALKTAVDEGILVRVSGPRRAQLHYLGPAVEDPPA